MLSGFARTLDLGATFDTYNESPNEAIADAKALYSDWRSVGESLAQAAEAVAADAPNHKTAEQVAELVEK
jgi:hypothetical protein